jgi:hypothetical protein
MASFFTARRASLACSRGKAVTRGRSDAANLALAPQQAFVVELRFWKNNGKKKGTFHLSVAGFFDSAKMFADGEPPQDMPVENAKLPPHSDELNESNDLWELALD